MDIMKVWRNRIPTRYYRRCITNPINTQTDLNNGDNHNNSNILSFSAQKAFRNLLTLEMPSSPPFLNATSSTVAPFVCVSYRHVHRPPPP